MTIVIDKLVRTDSLNEDFSSLVKLLDLELWQRYGDEQKFYNQFNKVDAIRHVVIAYRNNVPIGCGAIKKYDEDAMEVKRMFVKNDHRSGGIASRVLNELTDWAHELGFAACILETGDLQPEAIRLYTKNKFEIIPNYGQYAMVKRSVCMRKEIR